jgi:hypothetical protein
MKGNASFGAKRGVKKRWGISWRLSPGQQQLLISGTYVSVAARSTLPGDDNLRCLAGGVPSKGNLLVD